MNYGPRALSHLLSLSPSLGSVSSKVAPAYTPTLHLILKCLKRTQYRRTSIFGGLLRSLTFKLYDPIASTSLTKETAPSDACQTCFNIAKTGYLDYVKQHDEQLHEVLTVVYSGHIDPLKAIPLVHARLHDIPRPALTHFLYGLLRDQANTKVPPEKVLRILERLSLKRQRSLILLPLRSEYLGLEIVLTLVHLEESQAGSFETQTKERLYELLARAIEWERLKHDEDTQFYSRTYQNSGEPKHQALAFLVKVDQERENTRQKKQAVSTLQALINSILLGILVHKFLKTREIRRVSAASTPNWTTREDEIPLARMARMFIEETQAKDLEVESAPSKLLWTLNKTNLPMVPRPVKFPLGLSDDLRCATTLAGSIPRDYFVPVINFVSDLFSSILIKFKPPTDSYDDGKANLILLTSLLSTSPSLLPSDSLRILSESLVPSSVTENLEENTNADANMDDVSAILLSALIRNLVLAFISKKDMQSAVSCILSPGLDSESRSQLACSIWSQMSFLDAPTVLSEKDTEEVERLKAALALSVLVRPISGLTVLTMIKYLWYGDMKLVACRLAVKYPVSLEGQNTIVKRMITYLVQSRQPRIALQIFLSLPRGMKRIEHFNTLLSTHSEYIAEHVWDLLLTKGRYEDFEPNLESFNARFVYLSRGRDINQMLKDREEMWKRGILPDIVTYNSLIHGFAKAGKPNLVKKTLKEMRWRGIPFNNATVNSLLSFRRDGKIPSLQAFETHMKKWATVQSGDDGKELIDGVTENIYLQTVFARKNDWEEGERDAMIDKIWKETKEELEICDTSWKQHVGKARLNILRRAKGTQRTN